MKKKLTFLILASFAFIFTANAQTLLIQENFQDWKAEEGLEVPNKLNVGVPYSISKTLADGKTEGTFVSNLLIVNPALKIGKAGTIEGNGNPSNGAVLLKGTSTYLQLPELPSIGLVKIKAKTGTDLKRFKLQVSTDGKKFKDVPKSETECSKSVIKEFEFKLSYSKPTTLRIVSENYGIYIFDLEVYSYN